MRQHAIAALNLTQQAKQYSLGGNGGDAEPAANTALIDGVRRFAMDVRELDIDLIDRINPFREAYAILAKTMSEDKPETGRGGHLRQANEPDARGSERTCRACRPVQEGERTDTLSRLAGRMGEAHGRGAAAFMRFKKEGRYEQ